MKKICLWSGPRNVSTALMYSFAQRRDTRVVDEPLYGHYLRVSAAAHPGRDAVMESMNCDGDAVMARLLQSEAHDGRPVLFMKQMAHHLRDLDLAFLAAMDNVLLIRDPREMLPSLTVQLPCARLEDTGLALQSWLLARLHELGQEPSVLDSRELLLDPEGVLRQLCSRLSMEFDERMLRWEPGPRPEDGIWADHWYQSVHRSTGFAPYRRKEGFPARLEPLLAECRPHYENLYAHALRAREN
ncbi:MAG: sulfotransferase family protein [Gammaproteobacteria bacterium]|nr:sulfotransferase family protein [Gammaproteobacteria bacterium]MDH4256415.1 sulfotransferase family protein [Gammaproteobacteria bacterium]